MNRVILIGRVTKDPVVRYSTGNAQMAIARYTLAIDRPGKDKGADFIPCVCFDKQAEFSEKYIKKGTKIAVEGHIQTGSYDGKDGKKVYTTDVIVNRHEFVESKRQEKPAEGTSDFEPIPDGIDEELPFT